MSYNEALKMKLKWCGEDHPDVIFLYMEMSATYMMQGEHEQAFELLKKAADISERIKNAKFLHIIYQYKGMLLSMQKNSDLAIKAYDISIKHDPGDDPIIVKSYLYAARESRKACKHEFVLPYYEKALVVAERLLGVEHDDYISLLNEKAAYLDNIAR